MSRELLVAVMLISAGICVSGAGTHLYQWITSKQAELRYDGQTFFQVAGNLIISFFCGPYIMLQLGWRHEEDGSIPMTSALVSAAVAFGWAFITGLMFVGTFIAFL